MMLTHPRIADDQVLACEDCEADDASPSGGAPSLGAVGRREGAAGVLDRAAVRVSDIITSQTVVRCTHTVVPRGLRRALVTVFTAATHTLTSTTGRRPS